MELSVEYKRLLSQTSDLILEPDFQDISRQNVISSALECVNTKEDCMCRLVAWLLNPKEGHIQGEYFLKKLISGIYSSKNNQTLPDKPTALLNSYSNIQVMTEVAINEVDNKSKKRRIDILLADSNSRTLFIIERKDGTKAHSNQLVEYYKWAKKHYSDWNHFFILLDSKKKNHGDQMHPEYILLDDSWLTSAIKSLLKHNALPPQIEHTLQDIYDHVLGKWDDSKDAYFKSRKNKILRVAHQYSKTITELRTNEIKLEGKSYLLSQIDPTIYYSKILPREKTKKFSDEQLKLFNLLQSNHETISLIEDYSEFDQLSEQIEKIYPSVIVETLKDSFAFCLKRHEFNSDEYWPYFLEVERSKEECDSYYILSIASDKGTHESCKEIAEAFNILYDFESNRKKFKRKTLLGNIASLDISYGTELRNTIDAFVKKANSLPDIVR